MIVSVEISYYPLSERFENIIETFIDKISHDDLEIEIGKMSTVLTGEFQMVFKILVPAIEDLMEQYPSVFTMKISNSCPI